MEPFMKVQYSRIGEAIVIDGKAYIVSKLGYAVPAEDYIDALRAKLKAEIQSLKAEIERRDAKIRRLLKWTAAGKYEKLQQRADELADALDTIRKLAEEA